jgi:hypothetical protein
VIERTQDYRILTRLLSQKPVFSDDIYYLLEKEGSEILGVWACVKMRNAIVIHADMGPNCRGMKAVDSAKEAFKWLFKNVRVEKIYAKIEKEKKAACQIASRAGMKLVDSNKDSKLYEVSYG